MDTTKLPDLWSAEPPAEPHAVEAVEERLGFRLPAAYRDFLLDTANGLGFGSGVILYGTDSVEERNATYSFRTFVPAYLAVGDDSGGTFIAVPLAGSGIYSVPMGFMDETQLVLLGAELSAWVANGAPMAY